MSELRKRLNNDLDPTDADLCMSIAWQSLKLMEICQRLLHAEAAGMRMGRDNAGELSVQMITLGEKLGLVEIGDTASIQAFRKGLAPEFDVSPSVLPAEEWTVGMTETQIAEHTRSILRSTLKGFQAGERHALKSVQPAAPAPAPSATERERLQRCRLLLADWMSRPSVGSDEEEAAFGVMSQVLTELDALLTPPAPGQEREG